MHGHISTYLSIYVCIYVCMYVSITYYIMKQFSTGAPQEVLRHDAIPDYLVRATASFPLDCQIKKMTTVNTIAF